MQKSETRPHFIPHTKINSKLIKDLTVRPETIKILEENISNKISNISYSTIFSDISPWASVTKDKMYYIKKPHFLIRLFGCFGGEFCKFL